MARPIILSNGELHVGLNAYGMVHDFYYPYVGLENHSAGEQLRHKIGVWTDGTISWLDDGNWSFKFRYPHTALIGHTLAKNESLGLILEFDDFVDTSMSAFIRNIHIVNLLDRPREVRLYMHQAFAIGDSRSNTDTAQYLPDSDAILHYRGRRAFVISGRNGDQAFDQYSVGLFGIENHEGTFKDAEDGQLGGGNVEHGRVDSTIGFTVNLGVHSSDRVHYWIAAGTSMREALYIHKQIQDDGVIKRLHAAARWWHQWLEPTLKLADRLPVEYRQMLMQSAMVLKAHTDKRGAVIASTDSSMLNYSRDAYAYSWPRDGAYVLWPLIRLGYKDEAYRFFEFCKRGLHPNGYLMHKYRADGAVGSSWHPYVHENGVIAPPIQEDETALVLFVFVQFYQMHPSTSLLKEFYASMVKPMADFMCDYIEDATGLPKPSYDLWEEEFSTTTYTTSVVYGALLAASELAGDANDTESAVRWRSSANDIQAAARNRLFNTERNVFYKSLLYFDGTTTYNDAIDASAVFGSYLFGLFDADSNEVTSSVTTLQDVFGFSDQSYGIPRYENDYYRRESDDVIGNWWFIASLWLGQYHAEAGHRDITDGILRWVGSKAFKTGMLAEQVDPVSGRAISPAPLAWSHAEYISTLLDIADKPRG